MRNATNKNGEVDYMDAYGMKTIDEMFDSLRAAAARVKTPAELRKEKLAYERDARRELAAEMRNQLG